MEINIEEKGGVVILRCSGSLDSSTVASFKKHIWGSVEKGNYKFILDASHLSFIDSMGLGAVISLLRRVREEKGDIKIACLGREIQDIFNITRLNRLFEVYKDVKEALAKF